MGLLCTIGSVLTIDRPELCANHSGVLWVAHEGDETAHGEQRETAIAPLVVKCPYATSLPRIAGLSTVRANAGDEENLVSLTHRCLLQMSGWWWWAVPIAMAALQACQVNFKRDSPL